MSASASREKQSLGPVQSRNRFRREAARRVHVATAPCRSWLEAQPGAGGHHRWPAGVDGVDDLGAVDSLEVDRGDAQVGVSELALGHIQRHLSRAISTACA